MLFLSGNTNNGNTARRAFKDFEKFSEWTMNNYDWLPMTATVHKFIVPSRQIMESIVLPIGYFGE